MTERINEILKYYSINSSKLADKIGVQRSSISHVLSGRNKPSLDFIQKLLKTFPEINADWVILGKGKMILDENENNLFTDVGNVEKAKPKLIDRSMQEAGQESVQKETPIQSQLRKRDEASVLVKKTDKIVIFYSDNTYEEFYPKNS